MIVGHPIFGAGHIEMEINMNLIVYDQNRHYS